MEGTWKEECDDEDPGSDKRFFGNLRHSTLLGLLAVAYLVSYPSAGSHEQTLPMVLSGTKVKTYLNLFSLALHAAVTLPGYKRFQNSLNIRRSDQTATTTLNTNMANSADIKCQQKSEFFLKILKSIV